MTAITAITAQNTVGVSAVEAIAPRTIIAQVRAVAEDIGVDAVKIGMLARPRPSTRWSTRSPTSAGRRSSSTR